MTLHCLLHSVLRGNLFWCCMLDLERRVSIIVQQAWCPKSHALLTPDPILGTTFLQCTLARETSQSLLAEDSYMYLGRAPDFCGVPTIEGDRDQMGSYDFFVEKDQTQDGRLRISTSFQKLLQNALDRGMNAIVSSEMLYGMAKYINPNNTAVEVLYRDLSQDWEVLLVYGYRRFYNIAPSWYHESHRIREPDSPDRHHWSKYTVWPGELDEATQARGQAILPFSLALRFDTSRPERFVKRVKKARRKGISDTTIIQDSWGRVFPNSVLINVDELNEVSSEHRGDPLLVYLFCIVLPNSPRLCEASRNGTIGVVSDLNINPSSSFNYDMLACEAYERGLLQNNNKSRLEVGSLVRHRHEHELGRTQHEFPLDCLPDRELTWLLEISLRVEGNVYPERANMQGEQLAAYERDFRKRVDAKKYCSINTTQTLQDEDWVAFFQGL